MGKKHNNKVGAGEAELSVEAIVTEGTHVPMVQLRIGETPIALQTAMAYDLGTAIIHAATMAEQDAMLLMFFQQMGQIISRDPLEALQNLVRFRQMRHQIKAVQQEQLRVMQQIAAKRAEGAMGEAGGPTARRFDQPEFGYYPDQGEALDEEGQPA